MSEEEIPKEEVKKTFNLKVAQKEVEDLREKLTWLYNEFNELKNHVENFQPRPTEPPNKELEPVKSVSTEGGENVIIEAVGHVLGDGFQVTIKPANPGVTYSLEIIPPDQLKEHPDDRRVKVVPYLEGVAGAIEYAKIVRNFCMKWAGNNGRVYNWPAM